MVGTEFSAPGFIGVGDFVYRDEAVPVFVTADGACLTDRDGRRYLDATASNGAAALGYDSSIVRDAAQRIEMLPAQPSFCESQIRLELAERLADKVGRATGLSGRVAFSLGGAQGIELALKIARKNIPQGCFVVFEGGYHGRSIATAQLSSNRRYSSAFETVLPQQVVRLPSPDCERCRFQQRPETCAVECLRFVERSFNDELCGHSLPGGVSVSAMVFEAIQNVAGMARPDKRYLTGAVKVVRDQNGLVIADEIFTGLHRFGPAWGFELEAIKPDIVVISKALTNGMAPLSAVWARDPLLSPSNFPPGSDSITFGNVPWSMAVANAVLDRFDSLEMAQRVARLEQHLAGVARRLRERCDLIASAQVLGSVIRLRLRQSRAATVRSVARSVAMRDPVNGYHGVLLAATGMAPDVLSLHPPYVVSAEDVEAMETLTARALLSAEKW